MVSPLLPRTMLTAALAALTGTACAHGASSRSAVVANDELSVAERSPDPTVEVTLPPAEAPAPRGRPRLSQTVTLGQGTNEAVYGQQPVAASNAGGGPNVTVNNNVTVVNQPPAVYGGYGYGSYGYGLGSRTVTGGAVRDGVGTSAPGGRGAWAPSGWEGAQRTAAPGQTPGVGGNWAPAPSFGPRQMK